MTEHIERDSLDGPGAGLTEILLDAQLSPELDRRSRVASKSAFAIDRMRRKRLEEKLSEAPLDRYIRGLAALAEVPLTDIQQALNLPDWGQVDRATARLLARIARLIGLSEEDTGRFARWTFLGNTDEAQADALLLMPRGEHAQLPLEESLEQKEQQYTDERREELQAVLRAIHAEFDRGE